MISTEEKVKELTEELYKYPNVKEITYKKTTGVFTVFLDNKKKYYKGNGPFNFINTHSFCTVPGLILKDSRLTWCGSEYNKDNTVSSVMLALIGYNVRLK